MKILCLQTEFLDKKWIKCGHVKLTLFNQIFDTLRFEVVENSLVFDSHSAALIQVIEKSTFLHSRIKCQIPIGATIFSQKWENIKFLASSCLHCPSYQIDFPLKHLDKSQSKFPKPALVPAKKCCHFCLNTISDKLR